MPGPIRHTTAQMEQAETVGAYSHRSLNHIGLKRPARSVDRVKGLCKLDMTVHEEIQCISGI